MSLVILFLFGLVVGSLINVLGLRYKEGGRIFSQDIVSGRSACPHCAKQLSWYELIPLLSFFLQRGRCRSCKGPVSFQYPLLELLSGVLTVCVVSYFSHFFRLELFATEGVSLFPFYAFISLWLLVAYTLLVMSIIDIRFHIIPDQLNIFLGALGVLALTLKTYWSELFPFQGSFLSSYQDLLSLSSNIFLAAIIASLIGGIFFALIILLSKGRGMGLGDLKLIMALSLLLSWPDTVLMIMLSFIIGSLYSLPLLLFKKKSAKSALPFGPFIALAVFATIFTGPSILAWYFQLL